MRAHPYYSSYAIATEQSLFETSSPRDSSFAYPLLRTVIIGPCALIIKQLIIWCPLGLDLPSEYGLEEKERIVASTSELNCRSCERGINEERK